MRNAIRVYFCNGGAAARRAALWLYLCHGIRPQLIAPRPSLLDRILPAWRITALPASIPTKLHAHAMIDVASRQKDDRLALLCLPSPEAFDPYLPSLEAAFVLCSPEWLQRLSVEKRLPLTP